VEYKRRNVNSYLVRGISLCYAAERLLSNEPTNERTNERRSKYDWGIERQGRINPLACATRARRAKRIRTREREREQRMRRERKSGSREQPSAVPARRVLRVRVDSAPFRAAVGPSRPICAPHRPIASRPQRVHVRAHHYEPCRSSNAGAPPRLLEPVDAEPRKDVGIPFVPPCEP